MNGVYDSAEYAGTCRYSKKGEGQNKLVSARHRGGTCAYNPEPMADFIDLFIIGEGEEVNGEVTEEYRKARDSGVSKSDFLRAAARIKGVICPEPVRHRL